MTSFFRKALPFHILFSFLSVLTAGNTQADVPTLALVDLESSPDALRKGGASALLLAADDQDTSSGEYSKRLPNIVRLVSKKKLSASNLSALRSVVQGTGEVYTTAMLPGAWRTMGQPVANSCMRYADNKNYTTEQDSCIRGLSAWTSAAYDPAGHIYWRGGGHFAYEGNEIWRFDLATGEWSLAQESSRAIADTSDDKPNTYKPLYEDGTPGSSHHYAHLTWADNEDVIVMGPMLGFGDPPSRVEGVWEWSPSEGYAKTYENTAGWETSSTGSAYDPVTGNVLISPGDGTFKAYDPITNDVVSQRSGFRHRNFGSSFYFAPESRVAFDWKFRGQNFYWTRYNKDGTWGAAHTLGEDFRPRTLSPTAGAAERNGLIWFWDDYRDLFVLDPASLSDEKPKWIHIRNSDSAKAPTGKNSAGNYGKWWYVDSLDVFVGLSEPTQPLWVYRPPKTLPETDPLKAELKSKGFTCSDRVVNWRCPDVQEAVSGGGEVTLPKGDYRQCATVDRATTLDMQGARIKGVCEGKATFVQNAEFTLKNVECFGAKGNQGNEACIRRQTGPTTVTNVHFHDSYNGIIGGTGDTVLIEDSEFGPNLGGAEGISIGRAHGVYIKDGELIIRNTHFHQATDQGHLIKTGAARTVIENSQLDERGGTGSRVIDAYNGGEVIIRDTEIIADESDGNADVIGYDYEGRVEVSQNRIVLENNTVHCAGGWLVRGRNSISAAVMHLKGNNIEGCQQRN